MTTLPEKGLQVRLSLAGDARVEWTSTRGGLVRSGTYRKRRRVGRFLFGTVVGSWRQPDKDDKRKTIAMTCVLLEGELVRTIEVPTAWLRVRPARGVAKAA